MYFHILMERCDMLAFVIERICYQVIIAVQIYIIIMMVNPTDSR